MKKITLLISSFIFSSCSLFGGGGGPLLNCPAVKIDKHILSEGGFDVEVSGFEGYCHYDAASNDNYAMIVPKFTITRTTNPDESDVHLTFYSETKKGPPEFLGKKTHYTIAHIMEEDKESLHKGKEFQVRIPQDLDEFDIILGLEIPKPKAPKNLKKNQDKVIMEEY